MSASLYTLQYGTYTFPNQTFEIGGHQLGIDTPFSDVRRANNGVVLDGYLRTKTISIKGKIYGDDVDTVHSNYNNFLRALHNKGQAANFVYRADRYIPNVRLSPVGVNGIFEKGLYEYMYNVDAQLIARKPIALSTTLRTATGTRSNSSAIQAVTNAGNFPASPIFTIVGGTWNFSNHISVVNNGNSHQFTWFGLLVAGNTLVIDCDAGCVLLQNGLTMVDAISLFSGNLFFEIPEGGSSNLVIDGGTLSYTISSRDTFYI